MKIERREIDKDELIDTFWNLYTETDEYKSGRVHSINSTHGLVREAEERGLERVYNDFITELDSAGRLKDTLANRSLYDWLDEWQHMHKLLFMDLYKDCGRFRKNGEDVYFGAPEDKDRYDTPDGSNVQQEIVKVADLLRGTLNIVKANEMIDVCTFLAKVHYEFVRVHPFKDGNGRIARAIVDQISVSLGNIPVLAGFPRTNANVKDQYHRAIHDCIGDQNRTSLSKWIFEQMKSKTNNIA